MSATQTLIARAAERRAERKRDDAGRGIVSTLDLQRTRTRVGLVVIAVLALAVLAIASLGPLLWLAKSSVSTTQDILTDPFGWWPSGIQWHNLSEAWTRLGIGGYFLNTIWVVLGCWFFGLLVALTGAYTIAILKPKWAPLLSGAVLVTLFIPGVVSLVALYVTVLDLPLVHLNLINTFWAVWLPSAANAFNIMLLSRVFAGLPQDIFEAARIDGASNLRIFWSILIPMARPTLGVVSLLTVVGAWKEFLWPLLVLPDPSLQPLSVGIQKVAGTNDLALVLAGMFISVILPLVMFLCFRRQFLDNAGLGGAIKG
ncbi:carbohydrate ABC transporter permease [Microbacterium helvum]|nr:carbohydrate ABC transporter permease [Microbacterium helvum]